jgi:hypothetical protein
MSQPWRQPAGHLVQAPRYVPPPLAFLPWHFEPLHGSHMRESQRSTCMTSLSVFGVTALHVHDTAINNLVGCANVPMCFAWGSSTAEDRYEEKKILKGKRIEAMYNP